MLCCLLGHAPGETDYKELIRPDGYSRCERGERPRLKFEAWCWRCGARFKGEETLTPTAERAVEFATRELRTELGKVTTDAHLVRQERHALMAEIAKLKESSCSKT